MVKFQGYNIFLKQMRTDKGFRVEIDVSQDQYEYLKEIPILPEGIYEVVIKPVVD